MDLELGKKYLLSSCFSLRPFAGLRGTWLHTRYHVQTESSLPNSSIQIFPNFNPIFQKNKNRLVNHYWGMGLLGGLQPNFAFCRSLIIFSNFSGSLVWGKFWGDNVVSAKLKGTRIDTPQVFVNSTVKNKEKESFYRMQAMLGLSLGLRWEENWCSNRFRTSLDVGWEHHFWFNFGLRHQSTGSYDVTTNSNVNSYYLTESDLITDLELGGLTVRLRIDF